MATRTQAARIGGVTLQIVRDWVVKFNGSGADGLIDRKAPRATVEAEGGARGGARDHDRKRPNSGGAWVVRWRLVDLCQWIFDEFRITVSTQTLFWPDMSPQWVLLASLRGRRRALPKSAVVGVHWCGVVMENSSWNDVNSCSAL